MKFRIFFIFFLGAFFLHAQENERGSTTESTKKDTVIGTKRALVIGISEYDSSKLTLKYADDDAELFTSYLTKIEKVKEENITLLTNKEASSFNILNGLQQLIKSTKKNDIVYLFFAGHGDVVSKDNVEEKIGFLLASNVNDSREFYGTQGVVPFHEISVTVNAIANKEAKIILVLDACRSGYLSSEGTKNNLETFNKYLENSTKLLSCNPNELSYEGDNLTINEVKKGNGYFTYYLVLGLMGAADLLQDNKLQYFELQSFLDVNVKLATNNRQTPMVKSKSSTDFFRSLTANDKKEALEQVQNPSGIKNLLLNRSGSSKNEMLLNLNSDIIQQFNKALATENYYGNSESAYEIIKKAEKQQRNKEEIVQLMKNKLIVALSTRAQLLINDYIGNVAVLPNGNTFVKNAKHLEICLDLLEKDNFSYQRMLTSKLFLEAYAIIRNKQLAKYPIAKQKLEKALQMETKAAYIHNALGIVLNYEEDYKRSFDHYEKAQKLIPSWVFPFNNMGLNYYDKSDYPNAIKYLKIALSKKQTNGNVYNSLGVLSNAKGKYSEAEMYYHKVKEVNGTYLPITLRNLGSLYENKGNVKKAVDYFLEALDKDSTDVYSIFSYADILIDENIDPQKAKQLLQKAIKLEPYFSGGYAKYADFLRRYPKNNTDLVKADSLYKIAIKNNPFYVWAYAGKGWLLKKQKKNDEALASFLAGIKKNPKKASAYYYLGNYYNNGLSNKEKAREYFEQSLQTDSFYMPAYKGLITLLNSEKKYEESIEMLQKVIQRNPEAPLLYNLLGNTFYSKKEYEKAILYYQKAIQVDGTFAKGYSNLGYCKLLAKEYEEATNYFKLAAKYNPYNHKVSSFSKLYLLQARKAKRSNHLEEAKVVLEQAYQLDSSLATVFAMTEWYYFTNESHKTAELIEELNSFSAAKSWQIKKYELLTKIYIDLKEKDKAQVYLSALQKINPTPNYILQALVYSLQNKGTEAKASLQKVNSILLRDKFLERNYSTTTMKAIQKLQK
ncbi:tetratricopeptide repeat protein [Polaribacter sp.]|uniref:tetratricopeptide repeat protein n=1 Tax=Polaribacter sp. TaxID=1920175 RepID=UPI003EFA6F63